MTSAVDRYFTQILQQLPTVDTAAVDVVVVTHLLADRPPYLNAVGELATIRGVLAKPRSVHPGTLAAVRRTLPVDTANRDMLADPGQALDYLETRAAGRRVALLDVGGYFAASLPALCDKFSGHILGVVEDTENGHRRYLALPDAPCPIYSVARSPLKQNEDRLVGQAVVFSTEALLRGRGLTLPSRAAVLGFGKIGSSVARTLHARGIRVTVYDTDPVRATHAAAQGFRAAATLRTALAGAGLVVCATGNRALTGDDFTQLTPGAYVASVTSADDELDLTALTGRYTTARLDDHITRHQATGHHFHLLADGNAVNFIHGAGSAGPFIHLVQSEILAALARLTNDAPPAGYHAVCDTDRQTFARTWLSHFHAEGSQ